MKRFLLLLLLVGCSHRSTTHSDSLTSIQILDRNGFAETISTKDRLTAFEKINFSDPQPYQKVLRVYAKSHEGASQSKITTYHPNGQLWQLLEVENGRAHGLFQEWHANGKLKLEAVVIEGTPDIHEMAQISWVFEGISRAWDEDGNLLAEINYEKGALEGVSTFYHPNGALLKKVPYHKDVIDGAILVYDASGTLIEELFFKQGLKEGICKGVWYEELYERGSLKTGLYKDAAGTIIAQIQDGFGTSALVEDGKLRSLIEYRHGIAEGEIKNYSADGKLFTSCQMIEGKKQGEEWEYYSNGNPKVCIPWNEDEIQGVVKTWYIGGAIESQREYAHNKKQGLSFAWYQEGSLMLMEEYDDEKLVKGTYYKQNEKNPVSRVDLGKGVATLHDGSGRFLKKIPYEKGAPLLYLP